MTAADSNIDQVNADLERVAEQHGDLTAAVYQRFLDRCPEAAQLLGHTDQSMQGRMLEQTLELLLSDEHLAPGRYLDWELDNHLVGYRVTREMYAHFMEAIRAVVTDGADDAAAAAWEHRCALIMAHVDRFEAARTRR